MRDKPESERPRVRARPGQDPNKPKGRGGRPGIAITEEMCQKAEGMAACGMQQQHIAAALGMGESTYYEKQALYPEFAEAIKRGRAKGIALVTKALMDKAKNMDTASIIFYLKCQAGWREQPQQVAFTDPDGKPVAAPTMADFVAAMAAIKGSRGED